jgi:hypothetical protein
MLADPALVATVLSGVDGGDQGSFEAPGQVVAGVGHQPVVAVHEVEGEAVAELDPGGQHVGVHALHPGHELAQVSRALGLADAVNRHAIGLFLGRRLLSPPREHVHIDLQLDQGLGELANVTGQTALDQRRVLPGENQQPGH